MVRGIVPAAFQFGKTVKPYFRVNQYFPYIIYTKQSAGGNVCMETAIIIALIILAESLTGLFAYSLAAAAKKEPPSVIQKKAYYCDLQYPF